MLTHFQVLCCSPRDANTVLTCGSDGTVHLIDLRQPAPALALPHHMRTVPQSLGGGAVDSSHCTLRPPLLKMEQQVFAVDWNRTTGTQFVAASGWGDLRIYDIRKGIQQSAFDCVLSFRGLDQGDVTGCAWSKNGRRLVGSWMGGSACTFDVEDGTADRVSFGNRLRFRDSRHLSRTVEGQQEYARQSNM
jgi:WD40 repeat protein